MQNQKKTGQAEDWELSEEYYREDTGKKELRLEDFLEEEPAEADREGLAGADGLKEQLESMADRVKQIRDILVCMQSFPEDDPLAVARLIVLG